MITEPERVILQVSGTLERLGIPYAVGGSMASGRHGEVRATQDIDFLIDLPPAKVAPLAAALSPDYYVEESSMRDAVRLQRSFSVIHWEWSWKVDFFVAGDRLLDRRQLERRHALRVGGPEGRNVLFTSAEDIVLRKLDWLRLSDGVLERQRRDVLGVLKTAAQALDIAYLRTTAAAVGLSESLESCLRDAGLAP